MNYGLTLNIDEDHEVFDKINHSYIHLLHKYKKTPILIPNCLDNSDHYFSTLNIEGILFSGGIDLQTYCRIKNKRILSKTREYSELNLLRIAIRNKIPVLGICRGMQLLNEYFGGRLTLIDVKEFGVSHIGSLHEIKLTDNYLTRHLNQKNFRINSFHEYGIKTKSIGNNLIPFCYSEIDSIIEGFYHKELPILGLQWHPERFVKHHKLSEIILNHFFQHKFWWI